MDHTDIPADAKAAGAHAAPVDLSNPPSEATPSANGTEPHRVEEPAVDDRPVEEYATPEPIEVMYAQIRDDMRRSERLLMLTATTVVFMGLLFAYYVRKGGLLEVGE